MKMMWPPLTFAGVLCGVLMLGRPAVAQTQLAPLSASEVEPGLRVMLSLTHQAPSMEALARFEPGLADKLEQVLAQGNLPRIARIRALDALAQLNPAVGAKHAVRIIDDPAAAIRMRLAAAFTLGTRLGQRPSTILALSRALGAQDAGLREAAVRSLSSIATPKAEAILEAHRLSERNVMVRAALREDAARVRGVAPQALSREGRRLRPLIRTQQKEAKTDPTLAPATPPELTPAFSDQASQKAVQR